MIRNNLHTYMNSLQEKDSILYKYREQRKTFIAEQQQTAALVKNIQEQLIDAINKELTGK